MNNRLLSITSFFRACFEFLLFSNVFVGVCAVCFAQTFKLFVVADCSRYFVFFSTVGLYSLLKVNLFVKHVLSPINQYDKWLSKHYSLAKIILIIALLFASGLFFFLSFQQQLIIGGAGLLSLVYALPVLPFVKVKGLRQVGVIKPLIVAIVWVLITCVMPNADGLGLLHPSFLFRGAVVFVFVLCLVFEIKDAKTDREHGLQTIPNLIGVRATKGIAIALLLTLALYFLLNNPFTCSINPLAFFDLICVLVIVPIHADTNDVYYYFVLDGLMIVKYVVVWFSFAYFYQT